VRRVVLAVVAVAVLALLGCLAVGALAARDARAHALDAQRAAADGDLDAAVAATRAAADDAGRADAALTAPPVRVLVWLPWVGDDLRAVGDLAAATHLALDGAAVPLLEVAGDLAAAQADAPPGTVDVEALRAAAPHAEEAAAASARARRVVDAVQTETLLAALHDPAVQAVDAVVALDEGAQATATGLRIAPGALGADGPRTYLLAFQNLAEARPTGGIVGAWGLVTADRGTLVLESTGTNDEIENLRTTPRRLPEEVTDLYGTGMGLSQNVNLSPHFPLGAQLLTDLWVAQGRPAPDGVVALTPVALGRLLEATGPVDTPQVQLDAATVVDVVQAQAYSRFADDEPARQAYLGVVAAAAFGAVTAADPADPGVRAALGESAGDRHLQVWVRDEEVQAALDGLELTGSVPEGSGRSEVRLDVTNSDASKLDHYLRLAASSRCDPGPVVEVVLSLEGVPAEVPEYVTNKLDGADPRSHQVVLGLRLPPTRGLDGVQVDGVDVPVQLGTERGWSVVRLPVDVPADGSATVTALLNGDAQAPALVAQPLTHAPVLEPGRARCDR
jgi:hypothetical protein